MNIINFTFKEIQDCYQFAHNMRGNHNPNMIMNREDWEIFRDDFRGKLGEVAVRKYIQVYMPEATIDTDLDFTVTPRGQWDITDLVVNGHAINVKSIKQHSKFLLVEIDRYDQYGNYRYNNNDGQPVPIDYYVLVRVTVDPDVSKSIFKIKTLNDFINKAWDAKGRKEVNRNIYAEILGGISHVEFWNRKNFAPKGIKCTVKNLSAIANGKSIEDLPDNVIGSEFKNQILQRNNYIISSENQLHKLIDILKKNDGI
ncbi:MAG: hypothetical protein VB130_00630 [Clostridium sp.]|nr:hypothetical protein [Clostridium sp.]